MDYENYRPSMPYPECNSGDRENFRKAVARYREEEARLLDQFEADLFVETLKAPKDHAEALEIKKKGKLVFQRAWADGHDSGLESVAYWFKDLVCFARELGVDI